MTDNEIKSRLQIYTRLGAERYISSKWRRYANENFESWAWETFIVKNEGILEGECESVNTDDAVCKLHVVILREELDCD